MFTPRTPLLPAALLAAALATATHADPPEVVAIKADKVGMGWRISVTVRHDDTGWDHYADAWRVEDADGSVIDLRKLHHPHVTEQPFTRSLSSVVVPDGVHDLFIRTHCSVDGWSEATHPIKISPDM